MRKLCWHSNSPWSPTGYGQQTALFTPHVAEKWDLRISSFYGLEGAPVAWQDILVLPGIGNTYGNEALPLHVDQWFKEPREGLVVTLMDVWVLNIQMAKAMNMACWVPVDHDPVPPLVNHFFAQSCSVPIAMSRFGQERLAVFDALYCPHGVDTSVYRPVDRDKAREQLGLDGDDFVVGMVAANKGNPSRKSFAEALEAFAELRRRHANARILLHTDMDGSISAGVPLQPLIEALGIPDEAVHAIDQYRVHFKPLPSEKMALLYSAMDVLLNPATGEGFGVPVLEAQACGTPVIVTDFSAMQEVCGAGWKVGGQRWWTPQQSFQVKPDVADIVSALQHCYQLSPAARQELSAKAVEHASGYEVGKVVRDHMLPALDGAWDRFQDRAPVDVVSRTRAANRRKRQQKAAA